MEIQIQNTSGAHIFSLFDITITNVYTNITNIIVRISNKENLKKKALLINSHFDTTIGSPGNDNFL